MQKSFQQLPEFLTLFSKSNFENVHAALINSFIFILNLKDCWIMGLK